MFTPEVKTVIDLTKKFSIIRQKIRRLTTMINPIVNSGILIKFLNFLITIY